jgi:predicted negative regulator of RcsB-dependent stress response
MAQSLDLEEQEQLDQIKHFWNRYGNAITWALIVVFGSFSAWNGWQYWQRKQALGASVLYDTIERAVADKNTQLTERAFADLKNQFSSTTYAQQGALLAASGLSSAGKPEQAKAALVWATEQKGDEGLQALARLRLAALALAANAPEEAVKWLEAPVPTEFSGLAADRLGDAYLAQGKKAEARAAFEKAYQLLDEKAEYRQLVEVKLNALGFDPKAAATTATSAVSAK